MKWKEVPNVVVDLLSLQRIREALGKRALKEGRNTPEPQSVEGSNVSDRLEKKRKS